MEFKDNRFKMENERELVKAALDAAAALACDSARLTAAGARARHTERQTVAYDAYMLAAIGEAMAAKFNDADRETAREVAEENLKRQDSLNDALEEAIMGALKGM